MSDLAWLDDVESRFTHAARYGETPAARVALDAFHLLVSAVRIHAAKADRLERALRTLLAATRRSWVTWHVWSTAPDGTMRCILPQCAACAAEREAEEALQSGAQGHEVPGAGDVGVKHDAA